MGGIARASVGIGPGANPDVNSLGVDNNATPTQQTIISGTTALGVVAIPIKVPAGYYALLSGTGTEAIVGQIEFSQ